MTRSGRSGERVGVVRQHVDRDRLALQRPRRVGTERGQRLVGGDDADLDDADHLLLAVGHHHLDPTGGPGGGVDVGGEAQHAVLEVGVEALADDPRVVERCARRPGPDRRPRRARSTWRSAPWGRSTLSSVKVGAVLASPVTRIWAEATVVLATAGSGSSPTT